MTRSSLICRLSAVSLVLTWTCMGIVHADTTSSTTVVQGVLGRQIDDYLTNLSAFSYSGVMLVVKDNEVILRKGYGLADLQRKIPNTPETVFDIGSLMKQFTATSILKLEQQGKLTVTDRISQYLPGVPEDKQGITLEQLLTHTSGMDCDFPLADPDGEYYEEVNRDDAVRRILEVPLIGTPGQEFVYSNIGYVLLAAVVERVSAVPYRDFLQTQLFEPAGMHQTGFWGRSLPQVNDSLIARCYDESSRETGDPRRWSDSTWLDLGAGEVVSTVDDLLRWQTALADGRILPQAALQEMFTPQMGEYGYGWFIRQTPRGTTVIQHGGDYFGFGSQLSWFKDEQVVLCHLANRSNQIFGTRHVAERIVVQMIFGATDYHMFEGDAFELPPASETLTPEAVQRFTGTYQLDTGGKLVIYSDGDRLQIGAVGQDAVDAIAEAPDSALQRRARLDSVTVRMMNGMAEGDSSAFSADILREGGPLEGYRESIFQSLQDAQKNFGPLKSIEIEGTAPGTYPLGVMFTKVRLTCEQGSDTFDFVWLNDRIIGMTFAPAFLAATPLLKGVQSDLVGWSIVWFKGFELSFQPAEASEAVAALTIRHRSRTYEAVRGSN